MNAEAARLNDEAIKLAQAGRTEEALAVFRRAVHADAASAVAHSNLAVLLANLGRREESLTSCDEALAIDPRADETWNHRGRVLAELGRLDDALASFDRAVALRGDSFRAHYNRGSLLREKGRLAEAVEAYAKSAALQPAFALAHRSRGETLFYLGAYAQALASLDRAVALQPGDAVAHVARGSTLAVLKRHDEAAQAFLRALTLGSEQPGLRGLLYQAHANLCDWNGIGEVAADLVARVRAGERAAAPLVMLGITDSAADQARCAKTWTEGAAPAKEALWRGERYAHPRLRIAYLSSDFDEHAVAFLIARVFELHDRTRFEVFALSSGAPAGGAMRARIAAACEHLVDVGDRSDRDLAALIHSLEIDIVVDLNGHTLGSRTAALAYRPAPIAVSYLGFPGTLGAPYIDYIIADRYTIPEASEREYSEKVIVLPDTFQANDDKRTIATPPSRGEAGLPDGALVLSAFGNSYKITPAMFDVWMRVLAQCPGSVLWLIDGPPALSRNLRREAQTRGVDPARLVFAPRLPYEEHLARFSLADLFVDTLPFNGGATVSDALWAGVPALTCSGEAFAARMAGSLLHAIGLPELVTRSLHDYEQRALALARDRDTLRGLRANIARHRDSFPLFDTARFCRNLEAAYAAISTSSGA